jgi:3-deoxy-D-manno-octulosonic-acid transferase
LADYIYYLPIDTPKNARDFIQIIQPEIVFFVKYEFWYNYIIELHQRNIPLYLLSGIFRPKQYFFKSYAKWFKDKLGYFEHIFLQDQQSMRLLLEVGLQNVSVSGDTRFDRVYSNTLLPNQFDSVFQFCKNSRVIIAGSTWKKDEQLLQRAISSSLFETILPQETIKLIIAPHEVDESHLQSIEHLFKELKPIRWSEISKQPNYAHESKILLIDSVGSLMHLYQYADIAYIGGGFGAGIHNILEAACFGKPIIFGPNYRKFKEAIDLIQLKAAFCVNNTSELNETLIDLFQNNLQFNRIETSCKKYIIDNLGATNIVFNRSFGYNQLEFSAIEE